MNQFSIYRNRNHSRKILFIGLLMLLINNVFTIFIQNGQGYTYQYSSDSTVSYEINYQLNYTLLEPQSVILKAWFSRLNNWTQSETSNNTKIQQTLLKSLTSNINEANYSYDDTDIYGNSYDYFEKRIPAIGQGSRFFQIEYDYSVTLNAAQWNIPSNITNTVYNQTSEFYDLYTKTQPYCEVDDPLIQTKSNEIAGNITGIVDKAKAIYLYVVKNMEYAPQTDAFGAKRALQLLKGDCSEFSSLMVALLRVQGIPARKILGYGIVSGSIATPQPIFIPQLGSTWNYSSKAQNLPGHAWVQYYIPEYGWITCDPTWGQSLYQAGSSETQKEALALEYFNRIDICHLITTVGDWYGEGIDPAIPFSGGGINEFPFVAILNYISDWNLQISFKVTDVRLGNRGATTFDFWSWIMIGGSGAFILTIITLACYGKKTKRQSSYSSTKYVRF